LTQYGNVTMALKGTRPDGVPFEDSADFKFTPVTLQNENGFYNTLTITEFDNDQEYKFSLLRFLSAPDDVYQETALVFFIVINNLGDPEEEIVQVNFGINNYAVIGDDNKYFILNASNASAAELSNIAFDPVTNNLTFSYDFKFDGDFNDTGFPLEVSGEANVFVVEEVED
ncbi:hypothetical protein KIM67_00005, partial [Flagellimonas sp. 389]|uniref:hypothetical protein n=1 Tax=Flagellimonas sp. 389 TaxID=2835862 RepID=UPI001BD57814